MSPFPTELGDGQHTMPTPTLELVRCGCGLVRNDEDQPCWQLQAMSAALKPKYELPRVCRGCGCIYALPKQQPPSSSSSP